MLKKITSNIFIYVVFFMGSIFGTIITRCYTRDKLLKLEECIYHDAIRNNVAEIYLDKEDNVAYRWIRVIE